MSLAVNEVNANLTQLGHQLDFIVGETYGEEVSSIRQTANLWTKNVAGYIGPQETCVHEGRMAAAFNLPMISYVSVNEKYPNEMRSFLFACFRIVLHAQGYVQQKGFPHIRSNPSARLPDLQVGGIAAAGF